MGEIWMVRAGPSGRFFERFVDKSHIEVYLDGVTGPEVLDLSREELATRTTAANPTWSNRTVGIMVGQLYRFLHELQVKDEVTTYDPSQRRYVLGRVIGPGFETKEETFAREVVWERRVSRDPLSVETRNTLGSIMTIFRLGQEASEELRRLAVGLDAPESAQPAVIASSAIAAAELSEEELVADYLEKSREFIEDRIAKLGAYEMQDLVAGILRALGYKTQVANRGPDRGVDIFASRDGLGIQAPRIFVEVKHRRNQTMGAQEVRSFMGGRQPGDSCLYVSTGGFTKEARYEAERSNVPLTLIDLPRLRELLVEHYESVDTETKRLVPLVRAYWPTSSG